MTLTPSLTNPTKNLRSEYLSLCLEGFLFGLYSAIFALCLRYRLAYNKHTERTATKQILLYPLCALYVLTAGIIMLDTTSFIISQTNVSPTRIILSLHLSLGSLTIFGFCDFIAQSILIYRCWVVWGGNTRVIIIPTALAFACLATWLASNCSAFFTSNPLFVTWGPVLLSSFAMSMIVNALVTGLIVFKILKVFREVKIASDSGSSPALNEGSGSKLKSVIFVLIESGMALFSIQLARFVVIILWSSTPAYDVYPLIAIHEMLNGITPTIILVRMSMELSFDDEKSMVEATSSLHFVDPGRAHHSVETEARSQAV